MAVMLPLDGSGNCVGLGVNTRVQYGRLNIIEDGAQIADGVRIGSQCIIEDGVSIGASTRIGHRVILKAGTIIGEQCDIADGVMTTGPCRIGDHVNIRTGAVISKCTVLEDWVFVGPNVVTNHTKHVRHGREVKSEKLVTVIGYGSIVGSQAAIVAGVFICPVTVIGAAALVVKNIEQPNGVYVGAPCERVAEVPDDMMMLPPGNCGAQYVQDYERLIA